MAKGKSTNGIFTALGAASGLGNALRFPSLCAVYGGGFVFAYVLSLVFVCFPLLCAELYLGKRFSGALKDCAPKFRWLAYSAAINSAVIALYYGLISARLGCAFLSFTVSGRTLETGGFPLFTAGAFCLAAVWFILRNRGLRMARTGKVAVVSSLCAFAFLSAAVLIKGGRISAVFCFDFSDLAHGGLWADALGQSLLALSLAGGVMPTFARSLNLEKSIAPTAVKIIAANLAGCLLAAVTTLALSVPVPEGGGVTVALTLYPRVIAWAFANPVARRLFGIAFFAALWLVAIQSACSLFSPIVNLAGDYRRTAIITLCCILSLALIPVFSLFGGAVMQAVDRIACSVNAVFIAFSESLIFVYPRNMPDLKAFCGTFAAWLLKLFCPLACGALALFSVCGARFSCFPPFAAACAAVALLLVFSPAFVQIARALSSIVKTRLTRQKS